jgi:hypothetical protein
LSAVSIDAAFVASMLLGTLAAAKYESCKGRGTG